MNWKNKFKDLKKMLPQDKNKRFAVLLIALLALPITVVLVQRVVRYFTSAASATVYFEPATADIPPDNTLRLMVNSGSTKVGFVRVEVNFDRSKVRLTNEVSTTSMLTMNNADVSDIGSLPQDACTGTQKCIIKTPVNAANNTGKVILVLAKDPRVSQNAPSGNFELAQFTFTPNTTSKTTTDVTIASNQLVDLNANKFSVSTQKATFNLNSGQATVTPTTLPGGQTPFHGTPFQIPTTIQTEDFDNGGEGVAYHDTDASNNGGVSYRRGESVDISNTPDTSGTYHVGWVKPNEWLEYSVNVQNTGIYNFVARVVHDIGGGNFHVEFDGQDVTGSLKVPVTGTWDNFQDVEKQVYLTKGNHIMRVHFDSMGTSGSDVGDFNYFKFIWLGGATPTPGKCGSVPGDVNNDGKVNVLDIIKVVAVYQTEPPADPCADLNSDGKVNVLDIIKVISYYP